MYQHHPKESLAVNQENESNPFSKEHSILLTKIKKLVSVVTAFLTKLI